jgi:protein-S-isoprenylcysteine O-methyltransferase Ste14
MMIGRWMMVLTSLICFGSFTWAVRGHFRLQRRMPPGMQVVSLASLAAMAWFLARMLSGGVVTFWMAPVAMIAAAFVLFWWTVKVTRPRRLTLAFDDDLPIFLQQGGPYRRIRHPFYASYILFWIATSLATPGLLPWIVPIAFGATYVVAATKEEAKFMASPLALDYARYRSTTGMLLPLGWQRPKG